MEIGYTKQIFVSYLLYRPAYILSSYGRYFYFCYARYEKYAQPIYGCDECFNGAFIGLPPSLIETYESVLGLIIKNQAKLTMIAQLVFLPSIMLSGIMFPIDLLPDFLKMTGRIFPASCGYRLMLDKGFCLENLWYLILVFFMAVIVCGILLKKQKSK